jgi:MscS family membrane protein
MKFAINALQPGRTICRGAGVLCHGLLVLSIAIAQTAPASHTGHQPEAPSAKPEPAGVAEGPTTPESAPSKNQPPPADSLGRSTPYGCVVGFLQTVSNNKLSVATQYLDTKLPEDKAEELAKQLNAVLDAGFLGNIQRISRTEQGDLHDGLHVTQYNIGVATTPDGDLDVLLDRVQQPDGSYIWLFSAETLEQVPEAYSHLQTSGISSYLPESFTKIHFWGLSLWQWLVLVISILLALLLSSVITRLLLFIFRVALHLGKVQYEGEILRRLQQPVRVLLVSIVLVYLKSFSRSVLGRHYWTIAAEVLAALGFLWLLVRLADFVAEAATLRSRQAGVKERIAIISLGQRIFKMLAVLTMVLILLHQAGVNVSAMLAGLGIGGIALALAAQKMLEDLFGGISIISRETIRVGDMCKVADQQGTIEEIGLSSTRLRTQDRTVISIPNSKIAQQGSENFTLRDKFWFHHIFPVCFDQREPEIQNLLNSIDLVLTQDARVESATKRVNFIGFQGDSFQIEIFAYFKTSDSNTFYVQQQEMLVKVLSAMSSAGARLALPAQTTYLETSTEIQLLHPADDAQAKHDPKD